MEAAPDGAVDIVPLDRYDPARAKIAANLQWICAKAYGIGGPGARGRGGGRRGPLCGGGRRGGAGAAGAGASRCSRAEPLALGRGARAAGAGTLGPSRSRALGTSGVERPGEEGPGRGRRRGKRSPR